MDATASVPTSPRSTEPRTYLGNSQGSLLASLVSPPSIILFYRPPASGGLLYTLLLRINTRHGPRDVLHPMWRVPGHPLFDGRMGAYGEYHQRYSPYTPLTLVNRKTSRTPSRRMEYAQEIFPTHKNLG